MFRVDIYVVAKCSSNSKTLGKYGFVCTCAKKSGEIGKIQDTGQMKGSSIRRCRRIHEGIQEKHKKSRKEGELNGF
ncbi:hypothetical protein [Dorea longicatena]|uniref:hypothetical protein n=1 Tax=Dorea longicatena TaxID=88431 RepID=UPI003565C09B